MEFSVVLPTYNERENLEEVISRIDESLKGIQYEIIVVDDDSPDGTWELAEEISSERDNVECIRRVDEKGLSTAVLRGFDESKSDKLAVMDADLQHPPEKLKKIYEELSDNDIVVASRKTEGGEVENWPLHRKAVSKGAELVSRVLVPNSRKIKDPLSGYFGLRKEVIEDVEMNPTGYKILLEILSRGNYEDVKEIPYTFKAREKGSSSLGFKQYFTYLKHTFKLAKGKGELRRFIKFITVGFTGALLNMGILYLLTEYINLFYLLSGLFAVESSILSNFTLHELWTFKDRTGRTILNRLGKFHGISFGAMVINLTVLFMLTEFLGFYYLLSNLVGIASAAVWNFSMNTLYTWNREV